MAAECYHIYQIKEGGWGIVRLKPEARREVNQLKDQLQAHPDDPELKAQLAAARKVPHTNGCYTGQNTPQSNIRNWIERKPDRSGWRPPHIDFSIPNPKDQFFVRKCTARCSCPCAFARGEGQKQGLSDHAIARRKKFRLLNATIRNLRKELGKANVKISELGAYIAGLLVDIAERDDRITQLGKEHGELVEERATDRAIIVRQSQLIDSQAALIDSQAARIAELES